MAPEPNPIYEAEREESRDALAAMTEMDRAYFEPVI